VTVYPIENENVAERGRAFLSSISSFWREMHRDKELFIRYSSSLGELLAQRLVDTLYAFSTLGRHTMPVARQFNWKRVSFRQSDLATSTAGELKYGTEAVYGLASDNVTIRLYGDRSTSSVRKLDIPAAFVHASVLTDTPVEPSVVFVCGTDFWFDTDSSSLQFRVDPFTVSGMPVVDILDSDGYVEDKEITLWAFDCEYDVEDMSEHYGVLVGLTSTSSTDYIELVNSALDILADGPSLGSFKTFLISLAGERPVQTTGEVVQDITEVGEEWVVATDSEVYTFTSGATPVVSVGDVLTRGDAVSDAVQILDSLAELESLDGMMLDARLCSSLGNDLIGFGNEDMPIELETYGGLTKVSVELHGSSRAIRKFWADVHARGVTAGTTLADVLDLRESPTTQPWLTDLPKTINPLHLLLRELRGSLLVVKITPSSFSVNSPDVVLGTIIRRLLPARFVCMLMIETVTNVETVSLGSSTAGEFWIEDELGLGVAMGSLFGEEMDSISDLFSDNICS